MRRGYAAPRSHTDQIVSTYLSMKTPSSGGLHARFYGLSEDVFEVLLHEPDPIRGDIPEALVQDLWLNQRFDCSELTTVRGASVHILDPGRLNHDQGPDFLDARLEIGSTIWHGAVEIHTTSGIWMDHGHDHDPRYNATILHVSLYSDIWTGRLHRADETLLPELVLYPRLEAPLRRLIHTFHTRSERALACASGWRRVPEDVRDRWVRQMGVERFEHKKRHVGVVESLEQRVYEDVFAGLGYSKNTEAMRTLARSVRLDTVRTLDHPLDIESVYLGCAGLIPRASELLKSDRETVDYAMELQDRFERLKHKHRFTSMPATAWRFFRLRPANFPPLRIAQAAALLSIDRFLREEPVTRARHALLNASHPVRALRDLFEIRLSPFWRYHVRLDRRARQHSTAIGTSRIDTLLTNALLPVLGSHADRTGDMALSRAILEAAEHIPPESDTVTRRFETLGSPPANALMAQGLHQLFRTRCRDARCLTCDIGKYLLSESGGESAKRPVSAGI